MKKKAISILLTLVLCLTLLPTAALAEEITWPSTGGTVTVDSVEYTYQGDYTSKYLDLSSSPTGNNIYQAGSGYALWNGTTKTVTLHNASISGSNALEVPAGAQIVVEGTNALHGTSIALVCYSGGITVTGSGSLSITTAATGAWDYAVNAGSGDISINIAGDFTSNGIQAQSGTVTVKSGGAVTITGLVRAGSAVTVEAGTNLSITNSANMAVQSVNNGISLTAKNGNITVSGGNTYNQYAIQGTNGPVTLDASGEIQVADYNGYPGVKGSGLTVSGTIPAGTTLHTNCAVTVPAGKTLVNYGTLWLNTGGVTVNGTLSYGEGSSIKNASGEITPSGGGTINTAPVSASTLDFRSTAPDSVRKYVMTGGGTAKWEPGVDGAANTLTLNGVTMTGNSYVVGVPDNTEIILSGTNTITATGEYAIYAAGALKITGEGSLEVTAPSTDYALYGASGIDVDISGALKVTGQIRANGGPLSIKSGGAIAVTGSMYGTTSITAEAGTSLSVVNTNNSAITVSSGNTVISLAAKCGDLTVSGTGTAYAYGVNAYSSTDLSIHASGTVSVIGQAGSVYAGTLTLSGTVAEDAVLTASQVKALTIPAGKTLTNNGTIKLGYTPATVTVSGTLINNGTILNGSGALIEPTVNEGGVVTGKTDLDFTNRSADTSGEGYAWDNTSKTLTLTNYSMADPCSGPSVILPDGAKLVLVGANTLQSRDGALIEAKGSLDISSSGRLTGTAGGSAALNAQGDVTITDCTLDLSTSNANSSVINTNTHALTIGGTANVTLTDTASTGWGVNTGHGGDFTLESDAKLTIHAPVGILVGTGDVDTEVEIVRIAGTLVTAGCTNMCASLLGVKLDMTGSSITMADNTHIWLSQKENTLTGETNIKAFHGLLKVTTGNESAISYYKVSKDSTLGLYAEDSTVVFTAETIDGKPFIGWTATGVELTSPTNATISFTMPGNDVSLTTSYAIPVSGVSLDKSELSLVVGGTQTLTATVEPSDATNQAVTWSSSDPMIASVDENGVVTAQKAGIATITVTTMDGVKTAVCTVTVQDPSSGSSSSGGGSNTTTKTETNPDGSTTTTVTDKTTGTVTETTKNTDGSTTVVETKKDGTVTETNKSADGTTGTVVTDKNGDVTEVKSSVSSTAAKEAAKTGEAVTLPVEVPAVKTTGDAPAVDISVPQSSGSVKVEIPVEQVTPGTVAVIVKADGTEEIVKTSIPTENGVMLTLDSSAIVKIVDNSKEFVDVHPVNHWAEDAVDFASARGITDGTSDTTFSPNASCTRAQIVTFLWRTAGSPEPESLSSLSDVPADAYYAKAVAWALENGITEGTGNGMFSPDAICTRSQSVTFLYRTAGAPTASDDIAFSDITSESYYADAVAWAAQNGITSGIGNGLFGPANECSRAQIVTFLYRFILK